MTDTDMLYMGSLEKRLDDTETKNKELKDLLRETQLVLKTAFFADWQDTKASQELYDKITKAVRDVSNFDN